MTEIRRTRRLDHITSPLPDGELDDILAQLDTISAHLSNPKNPTLGNPDNPAGERAVYEAEQWGWQKYLQTLGRTPHLPPAEQTESAEKLVRYFCAIGASGGINQYSPRALREYFLNVHLDGSLLITVNESAVRRTGIPQP